MNMHLKGKKNNTIHGLLNSSNVWQDDPGEVESIAMEYFQQMYTSSNPSAIDNVTQLVSPTITPDMNVNLLLPFSSEEIKFAFFQMHPSKAPGPDGMTALFFQKYWHIMGLDVTKVVLDFFNTGQMLGCVNFTNIVLIPKVKTPTSTAQFRPISLCNMLYKIVSKVLVNKMKKMLPAIILEY